MMLGQTRTTYPRLPILLLCVSVVFLAFNGMLTRTQAQTPSELPDLPLSEYFTVLSDCQPSWDTDDSAIRTRVVAQDGQQLGYQSESVQLVFWYAYGDLAWQRWRWEYDCLLQYVLMQTEQAKIATQITPIATPTADPRTNPDYQKIVDVAVARGADATLATRIAEFVITHGNVSDFFEGVHLDVQYGEHWCASRSAACPLAPEKTDEGQT